MNYKEDVVLSDIRGSCVHVHNVCINKITRS